MSQSFEHKENHGGSTKEIWRVFWILLVVTLIELVLGFVLMKVNGEAMRLFIKGVICIFMLVKAFYIVAYFMHLKHEIKNFIVTIIVPLALFIWFIIAFLADGNSYKNLKSTYDPYYKERSETKVQKKEHGKEQHEAAPHGKKD